ncbi:hypothetical protein AJ80_07572 [Polytolypa hystricis UAMH7299]|uniref:DNA repair protein Swi5/Sae3 n=1 Tax=Polytolypa hystricis (strain UAMH7299) TaxID=1447883 RepID=A0A2B7XN90_POLH7|nr:hypothetical protein AJ80_07572 [Polytolypa hystricis UAMH7299]
MDPQKAEYMDAVTSQPPGTADASRSTSSNQKTSPAPGDPDKNAKTSLESKISQLSTQISDLESEISETQEKLNAVHPPQTRDASAIVQRHIRLLHEYNEIKDIGMGLLSLIADARGVRYVDVQKEFGVGEKD